MVMPHQITNYSSNTVSQVSSSGPSVMGVNSVVLSSGVSGGGVTNLHNNSGQHLNSHHPQSGAMPVPISVSAVTASNNVQQLGMMTNQGLPFQRLKVEDALSYLDQVKMRFGNRPNVYNDFLDIMKEFKSQAIDTPGVIGRVSQLFRGHPELIVGFNTFLPPGYKIEVNTNIPGHHTTVVHTPQGTHEHVNPSTALIINSPHNVLTPPLSSVPQQLPPQMGGQSNIPLVTTCNNTIKHGVGPNASLIHNAQGRPQSAILGVANIALSANNMSSAEATVASLIPSSNASSALMMDRGHHSPPSVPYSQQATTPTELLATNAHIGSAITPHHQSSESMQSLSTNTAPVTSPPLALAQLTAAPAAGAQQGATQPVEFNHAISYVNKIKQRFNNQPDIYKQFLEILHTYQKEQKTLKEGPLNPVVVKPGTLTEKEVYEKVARLFENQKDLLQEFSQFLPDATNSSDAHAAVSEYYMDHCNRPMHTPNKSLSDHHPLNSTSKKSPVNILANMSSTVLKSVPVGSSSPLANNVIASPQNNSPHPVLNNKNLLSPPHHATQFLNSSPTHSFMHSTNQVKRPASISHPSQPPTKKPKQYLKDASLADVSSYATLEEVHFFDQVRKTAKCKESYDNFLRCITLYNEELITRADLLALSQQFLGKTASLLRWFEDFITGNSNHQGGGREVTPHNEIVMCNNTRQMLERDMDYNLSNSKRIGHSYCAVPDHYSKIVCSGRTPLCDEVLNDKWVSFPSWSEDATFVSSKKTTFEEYIYRCEDERFELDNVLETNLSTIRVLELVLRNMNKMSPDEAQKFKLDDSLGGNSNTIHQRAIRRIYGDKAADIIDGLKKNPHVAVPLVLRRLKLKDEEWKDSQKNFNKMWRDQNEKYYYKSLDHQGINFKQNDIKTLRTKSLLNDIETVIYERHRDDDKDSEFLASGPHLTVCYPPVMSVVEDVSNLIIHVVKRQTSIHKDDKRKIKQLMRQFIPDFLFTDRQDMSDDERDNDDDEDDDDDMDDEEEGGKSKGSRERECKQTSSSNENSDNSFSSSSKRTTRGSMKTDTTAKSKKETDKEEEESEVVIKQEKEVTKSVNGGVSTEDEDKLVIKEEVDEAMEVEPKQEEGSEEPMQLSEGGNYTSGDEYRLFMCNNNWYFFLRLHQLLCHRLYNLLTLSEQICLREMNEKKKRSPDVSRMLKLKPKGEIPVEASYSYVLRMVKDLLDGHLDSNAYEDALREIFTIHAFPLFTLDKVIGSAVRQLQHIVGDEVCIQCTDVFLAEGERGGAGGTTASTTIRLPLEQAYCKRVEKYLEEDNCYRIYSHKRTRAMTIELLDSDLNEEDGGNNNSEDGEDVKPKVENNFGGLPSSVLDAMKWSDFVENYLGSIESSSLPGHMFVKAVFLIRNLKSFRAICQRTSDSQVSLEEKTQDKANNYNTVFVVNSDSCLYKKNALLRAKNSHKRVSTRKRANFLNFHNKWMKNHTKESDHRNVESWFMGKCDGLRPNKTTLEKIEAYDKPPFRKYHHYSYEMLDVSSSSSNGSSSGHSKDSSVPSSSGVSNNNSAPSAS